MERRPCRLEDAIRGVLELEGPELRRSGVRVVAELEPVPLVSADDGQIQQVLLNLIQNAQEAMAAQEGERVLTVRLVGIEGRVRIEVLDTGPGIPPEVLPRLFDAFMTTKPSGRGTGLGLWISHALVERHDGALRAENRPEGGAAFRVELPYAGAERCES
jgi:C4-dicarboxylate-specific signal transduction histidine kinase